jgi:alpha-amylase/alpha-mannosidase (GH57 family)
MTRVALLWHMHQPFYQDLMTGEHILPWVRLHALKDYWGMVALLREFPAVKATFNLVPSMLVQLEAFASGQARDRHLEIGLKDADRLTEEERAFCVEHFFHAHGPRMIDPYPRYAELLALRGEAGGLSARARASQFSTDDLRDLQVWHKLAWIDPFYHHGDERVRALIARGRGFGEADKLVLREVELELLRRVVPEYRDAAARGQVELSTSPFYHPILPLLCDTDVYLRTAPQSRMPRERFRHPEDAAEQLTRAVTLHERLFGRRPVGLWPSEGSVSDAMVPLVAAAGFEWMATDEEILARSIGASFERDAGGQVTRPEALYRPYRVGTGGPSVACGFRDHAASDLIGFTYASWSPDHAAGSFVDRIVEAGARYAAATGGQDATVFVILDGENAWEHYEGQGRPFLRALYGRLAGHPAIETVTMAEACAGASEPLPSIFPGSWINGDFYIWIGHADDHRAWSQLADARRALEAGSAGKPAAAVAQAREELFIAEGSDWFWWYGDDHSSEHDLEFDKLFRRHVRNIYRSLDLPIPEELFVSNITTQPPLVTVQPPSAFISPIIDGEMTSYFEWVGAGSMEVVRTAGAMHQAAAAEPGIAAIQFGFDADYLFIRIDPILGDSARTDGATLGSGVDLVIRFLRPAGLQVVVSRDGRLTRAELFERSADSGWQPRLATGLAAAAGRLVELRIPFVALGATPWTGVAFFVALVRGEEALEQHPQHGPIEAEVPAGGFGGANWTA